MKKNTKLILFSSFYIPESSQEERWRNYQFYYDLFSELSEGGVRSLLFDLVKKGYIKRFSLNNQSFFEITSAGISKLMLLFPGLKSNPKKRSDSEGFLLILLSSPSHDPHFQALRMRLKETFFVSLTKGVYYYSLSQLPIDFFELLVNNYSASVSLIEIKMFSLASPDLEKNNVFFKKNLQKSLSETSSRLLKLINTFDSDKKLFYQSKNIITSSFGEFVNILNDSQLALMEEKGVQELFFQAFQKWLSLVNLVYFSRN